MLSNDAVEKLIVPIARRQEDINNYIVGLIAKRLKDIGEVNASDVAKLNQLMNFGGDMQKIEKALAQATKMNVREIRNILYTAADTMYGDAKALYEFRGLPFVPLDENPALSALVEAISAETVESFENLSNTTAFMMNVGSIKRPLDIRETYKRVVDEAIQAVSTHTTDYYTEIRRTVKRMIDSGVRYYGYDSDPESKQFGRTFITYAPDSGRRYTRRIDSAARMNVLDGVKAINQRMQDAIGEQVGTDGKEISVHRFPAPDHAPVQGHIFTNEEYDKLQNEESSHDINGNSFPPMRRAIGLWNCRHFTFSTIIDVFPPNYSQEQLDRILRENNKGYTHGDKHYTMYQCTQLQREYETDIRRAKDGYIAAKRLGDSTLAEKYHNKVNKLSAEYRAFSAACGLSVKLNNMYVNGYKPE